jgi:dTDP-4-amino-4,6-dideoxygalactose transaminase
MTSNPYQVVRDFEAALCEYTGARYAVTTTSCTAALLLACAWHLRVPRGHAQHVIEIPKRTYVSVPMAIIHAGARPAFRDEDWCGTYQLKPLPVWDCARRFTSGMYAQNQFQCVSFHWTKVLGIQQGGAILHDDPQADGWLRKARFDGRTEGVHPKDDKFDVLGWHCYMSPEVAAEGLMRLSILPKHNTDLPNSDYPDLSTFEIFK